LFSTRSNVPPGSRSIAVGCVKASGWGGAGRTRTEPRRDTEPPARAVSVQRPALEKTSFARYEPGLAVARARERLGPVAVIRTIRRNDAGRTASRTVHAFPATAVGGFPRIDTCTGVAAPVNPTTSSPSAKTFMCVQTRLRARG
jgi:hypothetical protein